MSTVPGSITPQILAFCRSISRDRPVYIRSKPGADAQLSACFDNVARKIERVGGEVVYGWAIWHIPGLCFEAEHHGVWRNRKGALIDVSPQFANVPKMLFLPDPKAVYDRRSIRPNIIQAVDEHPIAVEFTALANYRNEILSSYRTSEYSIVSLSPTHQAKLNQIDRRLRELSALAGVRL